MPYTFDSTSQYMYTTTLPVATVPFTIAFWVLVTDVTSTSRCMMYFGDKDTTNQYYRLDWSSAKPRYRINDGTETTLAVGSNQAKNAWHHVTISEFAANDRYFWWNGGTVSHNTTTRNVTGMDVISFGVNYDTKSTYLNGYIGDVAIWNIGLDAVEDDMLSSGLCPLKIQPANLVTYIPTLSSFRDRINPQTNTYTAVGDPVLIDNTPFDNGGAGGLLRCVSPIISKYSHTTVSTDIFRPAYVQSNVIYGTMM